MAAETSASMAPQMPKQDIIDLIIYEHSKVRYDYEAFKKDKGGDKGRQMRCWELIRDVSIHAHKEEMVLYPQIRKFLGPEFSDRCLKEHQEMEKLLAEIDSMDPSDAVFEDKVRSAVELTLHHIEEEENEVLPKFKAAVNNNEDFLRELGMQFHAASVSAPTRPHPEAALQPPAIFSEAPQLVQADLKADLQRYGGVAHTMMPLLT